MFDAKSNTERIEHIFACCRPLAQQSAERDEFFHSVVLAGLAGPKGPVRTTELILGIVLFAPGCTYPAHAHSGITESYICLSGAVSENHQGVYAPGSMIFNPPEHLHRITVGKHEPALLAYAWMGSAAHLEEQVMVFNRKRR